MADTIARLIFQADTKGLEEADKQLANIAKNAKVAEKAATKQSRATRKQSAEEKKAAAIRRAEIKAYAEDIKRTKKAERDAALEKIKADKQKAKSVQKVTEAEKQAAKKQEAIRKAEINAYIEDVKRKEAADAKAAKQRAAEAKKREKEAERQRKLLEKQQKEAGKTKTANDKLAESFRNAGNATATLLGPLNPLSGRLSFIATGLKNVGVQGVVAGFALTKLSRDVLNGITAFAQYETEIFRIDALLEATGRSAALTSERIDTFAVSLARSTLTSATEVRAASAQLLTFQSIQGQAFLEALRQAQNISSVTGRSLQQTVTNLGRLLEKPTENFNALTRAGIRFNAEEKDIIKSLTVANKETLAQDFILKKLGKTFGDVAERQGKGLAGTLDTIGVEFQQLSENIGELALKFAPIKSTLDKFLEVLIEINKMLDKQAARPDTLGLEGAGTGAVIGSVLRGARTGAMAGPKGMLGGAVVGGAFGLMADNPRASQPTGGGAAFDPMNPLGNIFGDNAYRGPLRNQQSQASPNIPMRPGFTEAGEEAGGDTTLQEAGVESQRMLDFIAQEQEATLARLDAQKQFEDSRALMHQQAAELRMQIAADEILREHEQTIAREELKQGEHDAEIARLESLRDARMELLGAQYEAELQAKLQYQASLGSIEAKGALNRAAFEKKTTAAQTKQVIGQLSQRLSAAAGMNKAMFRISQIAAIAETVVNTREAMQLARSSYPPPIGGIMAAAELAAGAANLAAIKGQKFGGSGNVGGGGGGAVPAASAAAAAPIAPVVDEEVVGAQSVVNVTVDGSIDPSGARRIIEAINEATEDGLEINALVGT